MKKEIVSILGCGWVGKALAQQLEVTYSVKASVRSKEAYEALELEQKYILNTENHFEETLFYETDSLIVSLPPRENYLENLQQILKQIKEGTQLILLSSTSVYAQTFGTVIEEDTQNIEVPNLMLQGERLVQAFFPSVLILRLGGLMGYNRVAGKYTATKTLEHDAPVNYVHRDDVVNIIVRSIEKNIRSMVFNVTAPIGETKKEIYDFNAKKYGFEKTNFKSEEVRGKYVSSTKLVEELEYNFFYFKCENICAYIMKERYELNDIYKGGRRKFSS